MSNVISMHTRAPIGADDIGGVTVFLTQENRDLLVGLLSAKLLDLGAEKLRLEEQRASWERIWAALNMEQQPDDDSSREEIERQEAVMTRLMLDLLQA